MLDSSTVMEDKVSFVHLPSEDKDATQQSLRSSNVAVVLAGGSKVMREGLCAMFETKPGITVSAATSSLKEAVTTANNLNTNVLIALCGESENDLAHAKKIASQFCGELLIFLTGSEQDNVWPSSIPGGPVIRVLQDCSFRDILHAIRGTSFVGLRRSIKSPRGRKPASKGISQDSFALTRTELDIVRYVAAGLSNKEIARDLAYSEKTVKNYLSVIFQKLGVRDRTQAAICAMQWGLASASTSSTFIS